MNDIHPFETTISIVGTIVGGIVFLTLFFQLLGWLRRQTDSTTRIAIQDIFRDETLADVHLNNGKVFEQVKLSGFTDSTSVKGPFPYELNSMVILEHLDGKRVMIQGKSIRMIEVPPVGR